MCSGEKRMGIKLKEEGKEEREEKGERRKRDKVLGKMYSRTDLVPRTTSFASSSRVKNMNSSSPCVCTCGMPFLTIAAIRLDYCKQED